MKSQTMKPPDKKKAKENLHSLWKKGAKLPLENRLQLFNGLVAHLKGQKEHSYFRPVTSASGREVTIWDTYLHKERRMLMFASNNYLNLANHPYVRKKVVEAIDTYGVGVGGPPLLNGYTSLMRELEERLATFKQQEDAMIFSTGFQANLGMVGGLVQPADMVVYDALSHASFHDARKLTQAHCQGFRHNDLEDLEHLLNTAPAQTTNRFVAVEGVYSMDGDLAPLDRILTICRRYGAHLLVDDAHGTGVLGKTGSGTAEHFGLEGNIDVSMGTFSKVFAVTGGFLSASRDLINYLRYFARAYMFSAALPPMTLAAVLAGMDVIEQEPDRRNRLQSIVGYAKDRLRKFGLYAEPEAAIIALSVPQTMNIRQMAYEIHRRGIFLNAIEFPAVPMDQQRFRISLMSEHSREDVDHLVECLEEIWYKQLYRSD